MEHAREKLPSFKALQVLECAVRHRSFTKASQELHVTPSAVSKQIAHLENWLGGQMFDRTSDGLTPTRHAQTLAEAVSAASHGLLAAVGEIKAPQRREVLRIAAPATFAMRWLIPRLWTFSARHPTVKIDVIQTHAGEPLESFEYDVAIRAIRDGSPPPGSTPIMSERLGLVVSKRFAPRPGRQDRSLLNRIPLLESLSRGGELDAWLNFAGQRSAPLRSRLQYPHFYIALEAAIAGEGALVAPLRTIQDLLDQGLLVEPAQEVRMRGPEVVAFCLPGSEGVHYGPDFLAWLREQASCQVAKQAADPKARLANAPTLQIEPEPPALR